jgi:hypothetical protein
LSKRASGVKLSFAHGTPEPGLRSLIDELFRSLAIARPGNAAAAPRYRTFPIVIGETEGCFSVQSEIILR